MAKGTMMMMIMRKMMAVPQILLTLGLLASFGGVRAGVDALKHSYFTKEDGRAVIGPLGFPFGFTDSGLYNLTVFDFALSIGVHDDDEFEHGHGGNGNGGVDHDHEHDHEHENHVRKLLNPLDEIKGVGFLLRRFKDEGDFNNYMNWLQANSSRCAFEPFLNSYYDDDQDDELGLDFYEDDDLYELDGNGEVYDNAAKEGIFLSMMQKSRWGPATATVSYPFHKGEEGLYFLIYQICPGPSADIHSEFELDFHFSNLDVFGNESYLPAGEMALPHMFLYFSLLYAICLFLWVTNIRMIRKGGSGHWADPGGGRPIVYPIHHLMTILLCLKTLAIFCESIRYHYLRVVGRSVFWSGVYYTFAFMKGTFLFTVILLIGSGWSFVKPFLSDREKKMVFAILGLQVINNIALVVLTQETEGEQSFDRWTAILHMVDILCCCAVLIPIVWQVNSLEKSMAQSNGDHNDVDADVTLEDDVNLPEDEFEDEKPSNGRLAQKLKLFRNFYVLVICYIYTTRIVVYLFATMLDYRHTWLRYLVVEVVTLAFYTTVGMQFRPMIENPYLSIRKDEDFDGAMREVEIELTS
jgi:hypothetical protein